MGQWKATSRQIIPHPHKCTGCTKFLIPPQARPEELWTSPIAHFKAYLKTIVNKNALVIFENNLV